MKYDFSDRGKFLGEPVVLAVAFDIKKKKERVIVALENETKNILVGDEPDAFYDATSYWGEFLAEFETDNELLWNVYQSKLVESYKYERVAGIKRVGENQEARKWVESKYNSGNPILMFAAVKMWEYYRECRKRKSPPELLEERLYLLLRAFYQYSKKKPYEEPLEATRSRKFNAEDGKLETWKPTESCRFEVKVATASLYGVIYHCLHTIEQGSYKFWKCRICGGYLDKPNNRYKHCSVVCEQVAAKLAIIKHKDKRNAELRLAKDERYNAIREGITSEESENPDETKTSQVEIITKTAYSHWGYRKNSLAIALTKAIISPDEFNLFDNTYAVFRQELKIKKKALKSGEISEQEFLDWLNEQKDKAEKLINKILKT